MDPLTITGVDAQHIGNPRSDGTAGSRLYSVPIKLNRPATTIEAQLLLELWDHPSVIPTRHRPGILRIAGPTVVLDGTTIEEIRTFHAETLKRAIRLVNLEIAEYAAADAALAQAETDARDRRRAAEPEPVA
jgi:hypothetical protein